MNIGPYQLINEDKAYRAVSGTVNSRGLEQGGVGEAASDEAKLAEYDRLGGAVFLDGSKVKMGSFYDFKAKKPRETPEVLLQFNINGKVVEVPTDEPLPPLVQAAKLVEQGEVPEATGASMTTNGSKKKDKAAGKDKDTE